MSTAENTNQISASRPAARSQRVLACVLCQQRKVKCDRRFPCANCTKHNLQCVPATQTRRRRRRFAERDLLDRIRRYESLLRQNKVKFEPMHCEDEGLAVGHGSEDKNSPESSVAAESTASTPSRGRNAQAPKNFWHAMSQGLRDPDDEHTESNGGPVFSRDWANTFSHDNLLLGSRHAAVDLGTLHPEPAHIFRLWQIYLDNVSPLLKVTHTSSLQGRIIEAFGSTSTRLSRTDPNLEALMFSIYCMATLSLTPEDCEAKFDIRQADLLTKYHFGCQQALLNCDFLKTLDRDCLTAYFLYLLSVAKVTNPRSLCSMLGVAVRTAQRMGCHDESSLRRFSIFEAEMRRRLWWSLVLFDNRISQLAEHFSTVLVPTWDCAVPLNVNDSDLHSEMKSIPSTVKDSGMATEAIFAVVRSELGEFSRHSPYQLDFTCPAYKAIARPLPEGSDSATLGRMIEERYLRLCDAEVPLHFLTTWMTRSALAKDRLMEHYARFFTPSEQPTDSERQDALQQATLLLEADTHILTHPHTEGYTWFMRMHFPFPAYIHIVRELKREPLSSHAEELWEVMAQNYEARMCSKRIPDMAPFLRYMGVLYQAWEVLKEAQKKTGRSVSEPRIISSLKQRQLEKPQWAESGEGGSDGGSQAGQFGQMMDTSGEMTGDFNLSMASTLGTTPSTGNPGNGVGFDMNGGAPAPFVGTDPGVFGGLPAQAPMMDPFAFGNMYWGFGGRSGW